MYVVGLAVNPLVRAGHSHMPIVVAPALQNWIEPLDLRGAAAASVERVGAA